MGGKYSQLAEVEADVRMVLVGKIGAGKSAAGNTILARKIFKTTSSSSAVTSECQKETVEFDGQTLAVVDTPGLFDTMKHEVEIKQEVTKCISFVAPGPHVFLVVIQATTITKEDEETVRIFQKIFGKKSAHYTLVLFTHGDDLEADGCSIKKIIDDNRALCDFLKQCGGGYHVFNNRINDPSQVRELLKKVNTMVQRNVERYYANEMLREAERAMREEEGDIRMVLVGKTGVGKSATGNTILRKEVFKSSTSLSSVTSECQKEKAESEGQILVVVDTPGLFDTKLQPEEVRRQIARCISFAAPGPHVFLVVIQTGRFTEEEQQTVNILQRMFGEEAACYTMALFTRGDDLEQDKTNIEASISQNAALRDFLNHCGGGYHVFNNRNKDPSQVRELLKKIKTMVQRNKGRYYTKEMFQEAERAIREEMERLYKEFPNMPLNEARQRAEKDNGFIKGVVTTSGAAVAGAAAGAVVDIALAAAVGSALGPVGTVAGAGVGLIMAGVTIAVGKKKACTIQ